MLYSIYISALVLFSICSLFLFLLVAVAVAVLFSRSLLFHRSSPALPSVGHWNGPLIVGCHSPKNSPSNHANTPPFPSCSSSPLIFPHWMLQPSRLSTTEEQACGRKQANGPRVALLCRLVEGVPPSSAFGPRTTPRARGRQVHMTFARLPRAPSVGPPRLAARGVSR